VGGGGVVLWGGGLRLVGGGPGEGLVEEEFEGDDFGAGVVGCTVGEVAVWGLKDEGGEVGVFCAEVNR